MYYINLDFIKIYRKVSIESVNVCLFANRKTGIDIKSHMYVCIIIIMLKYFIDYLLELEINYNIL